MKRKHKDGKLMPPKLQWHSTRLLTGELRVRVLPEAPIKMNTVKVKKVKCPHCKARFKFTHLCKQWPETITGHGSSTDMFICRNYALKNRYQF